MTRLQIVGAGNMGSALIKGLVASGQFTPDELHIVHPDSEKHNKIRLLLPHTSLGTKPAPQIDAVIAVKPQVVRDVLPALAEAGTPRVLSIAAGVRTATIEAHMPEGTVVIRAMPNTPALVCEGASAVAPGAAATISDIDWAKSILNAVGTVVTVQECDMDAVTALSGSGPAYLFKLAETLTSAGIKQGLTPHIADALTRQTLLGASMLLASSDESPSQLRRNVTSPAGTTEAGLAVLEAANFADIVNAVISAAAERARQLS